MTWTVITNDPATLPPMWQVVVAAFPNGHVSFYVRTNTEDGKWLWARCYTVLYHSKELRWYSHEFEQDDDYQGITHWHPLPLPPEATP